MFQKTAYDLLKEERAAGCISTLCKDFDDAIGGGIPIGSITEIVGGPGSGKTQFWWVDCDNIVLIFSAFIRVVSLIEFRRFSFFPTWHDMTWKSLQLCANVQIPKKLRGQGGGAVYIDTNRGFSINRVRGTNHHIHSQPYALFMNFRSTQLQNFII